jgi:hypothetical protein
MEEWAANPQWWLSNAVSTIMGILLAAALPSLYRRATIGFRALMGRTKGRIQKAYKSLKLKRLKRVKALRFDSVAIHRRIAFSYAMLILFMVVGIATIVLLLILPPGMGSTRVAFVVGMFAAIPALGFEIAWLRASSQVDDLLKFRARIKPTRRSLR